MLIYTPSWVYVGMEFLDNSATHNTYLDLVYYLGIIGTVFIVASIYNAAKQKNPTSKRNWLNYGGWPCVIPMYFFLSELFSYDGPFHVLIALLVFKTDMQSEQGQTVKALIL